MAKCKTCGTELIDDNLTHCSNRCLFASLCNSKSVNGVPMEFWDDDPWI